MEILNLFSTPVYKNNLTGKDFSVVQEEILKSLEEINFVDTNKLNSNYLILSTLKLVQILKILIFCMSIIVQI